MNDHGLSHPEAPLDELTWREQEVLTLLGERLTNREIADRLHLAESTVKDYVGRILSKLYVKNRRQAVARAESLGLLASGQPSGATPKVHLPPDSTPFVGRKYELDQISRCLAQTRLLTITGPGGIGKTRLAIKAARAEFDEFEDGVFFVSLAPIRSVEHITQTIAEAVKFPLATQEPPLHQLLRYLGKRKLLLVMDNFEHILDGASIISQILQSAPGVKILATSRERLNLHSEAIFNVSGMALPELPGSSNPLDYDAITLFMQSAVKIRPGFDPPPKELEHIANICQIVQGMPLAIELAASWLHVLNVDDIVIELDQGLDILATEMRDAPDRHRSIRAVFDHSWSLLDGSERDTFLRLSVFRGGFTREAAQAVAGASLPQLSGLVSKSLLSHDPDSGRLELHELLRQYAQERLESIPGASFSTQGAHAAYYAEFMHQRWEHLKSPRQMLALAEIETDIENVRTAWRFMLDNRNCTALWKFIHGLWYVYWVRWWNHAAMALFAQAASVLASLENQEAVGLRALCMAYQAYFMGWLDLYDRGHALAEQAAEILEALDYPVALAFAYYSLGLNSYFLNRYSQEIAASQKMFEVTSGLNDKWLLAFTLFEVGMSALFKRDYPEAKRIAKTNLSLNEEIGDRIGSTLPLIILGHAALAQGEFESAREHYLQSLTISEQVGFFFGTQTASKYLGKVSISMGDLTNAKKYLQQSLTIAREVGFVRDNLNLLYEFARLRATQGHPVKAVELLALVHEHPLSRQARMFEGRICDSARELLDSLADELPQNAYAAAMMRGQTLELDQVVEELVAAGLSQ